MEPNDSGLASYYHPHQHPHLHPQQQQQQLQQPTCSTLSPPPPSTTTAAGVENSPVTNGITDGTASVLYPQSVVGKAPATLEPQRRKRGRPRKYNSPEAAAAAKRAAVPSSIKRKEQHNHHHFIPGSSSHSSASSKKSNFVSLGGQSFTPHIINVVNGEDVAQKILFFMQQANRELCILSASGSISNASLRQPATSGGCIAYEGRFDIISLTGSYVRSDKGREGGLSACLINTNGHIVGGVVAGPLIAAGPVEVIVATFMIDPKKDGSAGFKGDASASTIPSPVSASTAVYRPVVETSGGFSVASEGDDHQNMDENPFMIQNQWRSGLNYDLGGNMVPSSHDSPENGDYEQLPD